MERADQSNTIAIKSCVACLAGLLEESNFCRLCGAYQLSPTGPSPDAPILSSIRQQAPAASYATTRLPQGVQYHPVSAPLVRAVAAGLPASVSPSRTKELPRRLLLALMAIPIWVMIILLSPIDAYASAKIIGERI